ncbi:hypothetical protein C8R48DRAFT_674003 [Suillus tomentosus]|nr:hypothetical protein C8R48DRAFT_674003 [Suillus tomentosus]
MLGEYGIGDQGLGIQNSVKSQVTSSESRVPNPGVPSAEFRRSGFGDLELGNCVGCQGAWSIGDSICHELRVPKPHPAVAELRVAEPRPPKFGIRDSGFGTRDSELVTWDLTLF